MSRWIRCRRRPAGLHAGGESAVCGWAGGSGSGAVDGRSGFLAVQPGEPIEEVVDRRGSRVSEGVWIAHGWGLLTGPCGRWGVWVGASGAGLVWWRW